METKLTAEQIADWEKEELIEALWSGCIELNDEFLTRYCGEKIQAMMLPIPEHARNWVIRGCLEDNTAYWAGFYCSLEDNQIFIDCPEIETQIGSPDELENPDDFVINKCGDGYLAYSCPGSGLAIPVNLEKLQAEIEEEKCNF